MTLTYRCIRSYITPCLLLAFIFHTASAQQYVVRQKAFTIEKETTASDSYIRNVVTATNGYTYAITSQGVYRYNGVNFKQLPLQVNGTILQAAISEKDHLILVTQNTIQRNVTYYDLNTNSTIPLEANTQPIIEANDLIEVSNDINGNLWLTYDAATEERASRQLIIRNKNGMQDSLYIDAIYTDFYVNGSNTWIRVEDHSFLEFTDQLKPTGQSMTTYSGDVFLTPSGGAFKPLTTYQGTLTNSLSGEKTKDVEWIPFSAPFNTIWWKHASKSDLYKVTNVSGQLLAEFTIPESGLPDLSIQPHILDMNTKRMWFTLGPGRLYSVELFTVPFRKIMHTYQAGLDNMRTRDLWSNDTTLLIGGSLSSFLYDFINDSIIGKYDEMISFTEMANETIYGTDEGLDYGPADGLDIFAIRPKENQIEQLLDNSQSDLELYLGWAIVYLEDQLIMGSVGGLSVYNFQSKQHQYIRQPEEFSDFTTYEVYEILKKEDELIILTDHGLYAANHDGVVTKKFKDFAPGDPRAPLAVYDAIQLDDENYILGTESEGLLFFSASEGVYDSLTVKDGLSSNSIYAVLSDEELNIWASSPNGLNRINKNKTEINVFREKHGLNSNIFNLKSRFKSSSGQLYFGGAKGVVSFNPADYNEPDKLISKPSIAQVTQILKGENEQIPIEATTIHNYPISSDHSSIFITPVYLNDIMLESIDFMYRLPATDDGWETVINGEIKLPSLPYGDYALEVRVKNRLGLWSDTLFVNLDVKKPYFLQAWFLILILAILGVIGYLIYRWRVRQYQVKSEELEAVVAERTAQLKLQSKELKELNKTQIRFFTNISHELRTPLTLIYSPVKDVIQNLNEYSPEQIIDTLNVVEHSSDILKKLIDEILDISILEKGELKLEIEDIPQALFFENILFNFRKLAENKQQKLIVNNHLEQDISIKTDVRKVEKIVTNLVGNAIKFTPEHGEITVQITKHKSVLQVQVEDSGPGIPEEISSRIFERFFQGNTSKTNEGFGIGLSMANDLTRLIGGKIKLKSQAGEGAKFTVELPVAFSNFKPPSEAKPIAHQEHQPTAQRSTILLVEDNPELLRFIAELLSKKHQIITARDGNEAWQILQDDFEHKHDIKMVISDIMMPHLDGYGLLELVRSNHGIKAVSFLFLSALNSKQNIIKGFATGVDSYITKPFQPNELRIVVDSILKRYEDRCEFHANLKEMEDQTQRLDLISGENWIWLNQVETLIREKASEQDFNIEELANQFHISYRQFNRKIKSLTGMSPIQYQREIKLILANEKLTSTNKSFKEVAVELGFSRTSYLRKLYKERFPA